MTKLTALALVALALTGCGTQSLASAPRTSAPTAAAARQETQLYGAFIRGKVLKATTLTNQDEDGKPFEFQELTVDAKPGRGQAAGPHGKVVFRVITGNPLAKVGQTIDAFIDYPRIDAKGTFINTAGKPYWVHELKIVD